MIDKKSPFDFSEREQRILKSLVDHYISEGQPIGSRTLSKLPGIDISAASIRNVMGDLEQMGMLKSPHTSAGRIPTSKAYRVFVDTMLEVQPVGDSTVADFRHALDPNLSDQHLIKVASNFLSGVTTMAGMVTVPKRGDQSMHQVEFLPLSDNRVLAILIIDHKEVQNRIIKLDRSYSKSELDEASNYLNAEFLGKPLNEMRDAIREELQKTRADMSTRMQMIIEVAGKVFEDDPESADVEEETMVVAGETNLMSHSDLSDVDTLKGLFEAFEKKRDIYHLLERCISAEGVQIFIGRESGHDLLDDFSVITSPYEKEGELVGVLGVIGPKRMAYDRVIPVVDITSRLLSAALNSPK